MLGPIFTDSAPDVNTMADIPTKMATAIPKIKVIFFLLLVIMRIRVNIYAISLKSTSRLNNASFALNAAGKVYGNRTLLWVIIEQLWLGGS